MEKVHPWCGQPSDRGRLYKRTEQNRIVFVGWLQARLQAERREAQKRDDTEALKARLESDKIWAAASVLCCDPTDEDRHTVVVFRRGCRWNVGRLRSEMTSRR